MVTLELGSSKLPAPGSKSQSFLPELTVLRRTSKSLERATFFRYITSSLVALLQSQTKQLGSRLQSRSSDDRLGHRMTLNENKPQPRHILQPSNYHRCWQICSLKSLFLFVVPQQDKSFFGCLRREILTSSRIKRCM